MANTQCLIFLGIFIMISILQTRKLRLIGVVRLAQHHEIGNECN